MAETTQGEEKWLDKSRDTHARKDYALRRDVRGAVAGGMRGRR